MNNILLICSIVHFESIVNKIKALIPDIYTSSNFEDIFSRIKTDEVKRICIIMGAYNYSGSSFNNIIGQEAAKLFHKSKPDIKILVWDGRDVEVVDGRVKEVPVTEDNEIYLESGPGVDFYGTTKKFFDGGLTSDDIPSRVCLDMSRRSF